MAASNTNPPDLQQSRELTPSLKEKAKSSDIQRSEVTLLLPSPYLCVSEVIRRHQIEEIITNSDNNIFGTKKGITSWLESNSLSNTHSRIRFLNPKIANLERYLKNINKIIDGKGLYSVSNYLRVNDLPLAYSTTHHIYGKVEDVLRFIFKRSVIDMFKPQGLAVINNFITEDEEDKLLRFINDAKWNSSLSRRTQHYGYEYNYSTIGRELPGSSPLADLKEAAKIPDMLDVFKRFRDSFPDESKSSEPVSHADSSPGDNYITLNDLAFDQIIVNEYNPGQGISKHVDSSVFDDLIISLSLESDIIMKVGNVNIVLKRRSLLILCKEARWDVPHMISPRLNDTIDGVLQARERKVSITYRKVKK
jgi:hypothetical protein